MKTYFQLKNKKFGFFFVSLRSSRMLLFPRTSSVIYILPFQVKPCSVQDFFSIASTNTFYLVKKIFFVFLSLCIGQEFAIIKKSYCQSPVDIKNIISLGEAYFTHFMSGTQRIQIAREWSVTLTDVVLMFHFPEYTGFRVEIFARMYFQDQPIFDSRLPNCFCRGQCQIFNSRFNYLQRVLTNFFQVLVIQ